MVNDLSLTRHSSGKLLFMCKTQDIALFNLYQNNLCSYVDTNGLL